MQRFVAVGAQGDEVQFVVALLAPQFLVVDMEILPGTTELASLAIAPQYLFPQLVVQFESSASAVAWVEFGSRRFPGHFMQKSLPLFPRQKFEEP